MRGVKGDSLKNFMNIGPDGFGDAVSLVEPSSLFFQLFEPLQVLFSDRFHIDPVLSRLSTVVVDSFINLTNRHHKHFVKQKI